MAYIGQQPPAVALTASDITDGIISTAKIANDAVDNTKLDLTDNYAFTGTITGAGGGKLGQVVSDVSTSKYSTNSTSYASIFTPSTITPSATTSKILVSWYCSIAVLSNTSNLGHIAVQREIGGSTYAYVNSSSGHNTSMYTFKADANQQGYGLSFEFLDSPNTTSAVRYYVQHKVDNSGVTLYLNQNQGGQGGHMFMNQKEILA